MPSDYDFPKIKSFRKVRILQPTSIKPQKFQKVGLPSMSKWHVSSEDTLVSGRILTMVKHKVIFQEKRIKSIQFEGIFLWWIEQRKAARNNRDKTRLHDYLLCGWEGLRCGYPGIYESDNKYNHIES